MRSSRTAVVAPLLALVVASSASAGVVMQYKTYGSGGKTQDKPETGSVQMQGESLRMETPENTVIFRGDKQVLWILQPADGTYTEMDKATLEQASSAMSEAMAEMKSQMASLPPEQRAMVEKMMSAQAQPGAAPAPVPERLEATGKTETISGHATTAWNSYRGDEKVRESWVTDWKSFGLTATDFKPLEEMADFMRALTKGMPQKADSGFAAKYTGKDALPGVPMRIVSFGKCESTATPTTVGAPSTTWRSRWCARRSCVITWSRR